VSTRVLTWNLQGRERPDLDAVAEVLRERGPDVIALQEVQRRQATDLAHRLGWWCTWRFKHWSVVVPAEGLALLAPGPLADLQRAHLAGAARLWSWRRRIALAGTLLTPEGPITVVDVHLGAGVTDAERARQARRTAALLRGPGCVVGDLNTRPGSVVLGAFAEGGLRDAWAEARPGEPGPTNWRAGPRDGGPTKRLDYVLVTDDLDVRSAELPVSGEPGFARFGTLSDHLPLTVELSPRAS
jgi:endonuclease/exonuclease/phosphatase family metal-dependent hydrolase